jgi:hypothetical protein
MKTIREELLGPNDFARIKKLVLDKMDEIIYSDWHYVLHLPEKDLLLIHHTSVYGNLSFVKEKSLLSCLTELQNPTFDDYLYYATLYPLLLPERCKTARTDLPPALERIIQIGKGHIIFYHQLEILYSCLTGCSAHEAKAFRRDWNMKKRTVRESARQIMVTEECSLYELLLQLTTNANQFVYQGNFQGAWHLYNELMSTSK